LDSNENAGLEKHEHCEIVTWFWLNYIIVERHTTNGSP